VTSVAVTARSNSSLRALTMLALVPFDLRPEPAHCRQLSDIRRLFSDLE
jgi:hypothetical protein